MYTFVCILCTFLIIIKSDTYESLFFVFFFFQVEKKNGRHTIHRLPFDRVSGKDSFTRTHLNGETISLILGEEWQRVVRQSWIIFIITYLDPPVGLPRPFRIRWDVKSLRRGVDWTLQWPITQIIKYGEILDEPRYKWKLILPHLTPSGKERDSFLSFRSIYGFLEGMVMKSVNWRLKWTCILKRKIILFQLVKHI